MSQISDHVSVNITRDTAKITRTGFGTPMIVGPFSCNENRTTTYTDESGMLDDGFLTTDDLYIAAQKLMSQELSPTQFKIGRKLEDVNEIQVVTFTGSPSAGTWTLTYSGATTSALTYDESAGDVETALETLAGITSCSVTGTMATGFTIEFDGADAATAMETLTVDVASLTGATAGTVTVTQYGSAVETWSACVAAVIADDPDFYFLTTTTRTKADILLIAAAIESELKMYFIATDESDITGNVAANTLKSLKVLSYDNTCLLWNGVPTVFPENCWVGGQAPKDPGSTTWKFKTLVGATPDVLTATQKGYIDADYGNYYETIGGLNKITSEAVMVSGEYIDIIRGTAWLQTRMAEGIFAVLGGSEKVPFTAQGIGSIEGVIRYWLNKAESPEVGLLVPGGSTITVPDIDDVDPAEKILRLLTGISFTGTYAGAIHKVRVTGKLSIN
jgi:hypothetical protein